MARSAKNFGIDDLILINPCILGEEANKRAMHGKDILLSARTYLDLETAIKEEGLEVLAATSGVVNLSAKCHRRNPITCAEFASEIQEVHGNVGLLFGREDFGLFKPEISRCDYLINIPTSEQYGIMNLSHAATIVFYELYKPHAKPIEGPHKTSAFEREKFFEHYQKLLDVIDYPDWRREKAEVLFRRMVTRSNPTKWEYHTMMGVFSMAMKRIKMGPRPKPAKEPPKAKAPKYVHETPRKLAKDNQ